MSDSAFELQFWKTVYQKNRRDAVVLEALANAYAKAGRFDDSIKLDRRHVRLDPFNPAAHYNLACSLALKKRRKAALQSLRNALELGYDDFSWMQQDPDLKSLHGDPVFHKMVQKYQAIQLEAL